MPSPLLAHLTPYQQALADVVLQTTFKVEEHDYFVGTPNDGCRCPIALCIRRTLGTTAPVSVCAATIRVDKVWFVTPRVVDDYIKAYDRRDDACFTLEFQITELA